MSPPKGPPPVRFAWRKRSVPRLFPAHSAMYSPSYDPDFKRFDTFSPESGELLPATARQCVTRRHSVSADCTHLRSSRFCGQLPLATRPRAREKCIQSSLTCKMRQIRWNGFSFPCANRAGTGDECVTYAASLHPALHDGPIDAYAFTMPLAYVEPCHDVGCGRIACEIFPEIHDFLCCVAGPVAPARPCSTSTRIAPTPPHVRVQ